MIINQDLKNMYKNTIDEILSVHGLTNQCVLSFNNGSADYCNNCIFDSISKVSANIYNNIGPQQFPDFTICPVCMGLGVMQTNKKTKIVTMAVIFDSKYFINFDKKVVNIPDGMIQTISTKNYIIDIRNSSAISINNISYERVGDVTFAGLGDLEYIFTTWKRL